MNLQKFKNTLESVENKKYSLLKIDTMQPLTKQILKIGRYLSKATKILNYLPLKLEYIHLTSLEDLQTSGISDDERILLRSLFEVKGKFKEFYLQDERENGRMITYSREKSASWGLRENRNTNLKNTNILDLIIAEILGEINTTKKAINDLSYIQKVNNEFDDKNSKGWRYFYGGKCIESKEEYISKTEEKYNIKLDMCDEIQAKIQIYVAKINGVIYQVNEQNRLRAEFSRATITDRKKQDSNKNDELIKELEVFKLTAVEIDKDTEHDKLQQFKTHLQTFLNSLKLDLNLRHFKIRYLGNYKALGLYIDSLKLIALDLRDTTAIVHEIGHYLDFFMGTLQYSLRNDFGRILDLYINGLNERTELHKKFEYYAQPTEIFARAFDYYCQNCRIVPEELKHKITPDYEIIFENTELEKEIIKFFDKLNLIK